MTDPEEIKYWNDFIDGDLNTLSVLFKHYAKGLFYYGMKICQDEELVEDSIQEVFIKLIQHRHKLRRGIKAGGLLYRLLRNKIIDEIKLRNRNKITELLTFNNDTAFDMDAEHLHINFEEEIQRNSLFTSAMDQLSSHQKEVLLLKYSSGFSYEEVSAVMGISVASTRTLVYRTLKQLKSLLSLKVVE